MSDLAATNCGCNDNGGCGNIIWLILLLSCCGCGNGNNSLFGNNNGNDSCLWLILILLCCNNGNNFGCF